MYCIFHEKISDCFTNSKKISFITLGNIKQGEGKLIFQHTVEVCLAQIQKI